MIKQIFNIFSNRLIRPLPFHFSNTNQKQQPPQLTLINEHNSKIKQIKQQLQSMRNKYAELKIKDEANIQKYEKKLLNEKLKYEKQILKLNEELTKNLRAIDKEQKLDFLKEFIIQGLKEEERLDPKKHMKHQKQQSQSAFIPNHLVLKKLYNGDKTKKNQLTPNKQILLAGCQKDNEEHCIYIKRLIQQMNIKNVLTLIPPDLPYFIKTETSYLFEWAAFLKYPDYARRTKFFLNPKPAVLTDICLKKHHIQVVKNSLSNSNNFLSSVYYMMQKSDFKGKFQYNPLLSGFVATGVQNMYFCDYPAFKQRQMTANRLSLTYLRNLFQQYLAHGEQRKFNFSPQLLFPKEILANKFNHVIAVARAVTQISDDRSIIICPADMAELISLQWQTKSTSKNLVYNYQENNYYFVFQDFANSSQRPQTFIEFIQKLVILDLILQPIFYKYFVKYESFPTLCLHTIGGHQNVGKIFMVWNHFYKPYYDALEKKKLNVLHVDMTGMIHGE